MGVQKGAAGQATAELTPPVALTPEIVADIRRRAERRDRKGWEASVVPVEALYALCDAADALAAAQHRLALLELERGERAKAYHAAEGAFAEQRAELARERRRAAALERALELLADGESYAGQYDAGRAPVHPADIARAALVAADAPGRPGGEGEGHGE